MPTAPSLNPWVATYSGRQFFFLRATKDDIYIEDIAHGLSNICRYVGQCHKNYSVAEHCVRAAQLAVDQPVELKLAILLHDASEAYLNDIPGLVKPLFTEYVDLERYLTYIIYKKYGVSKYVGDIVVKLYDKRMLQPEVLSLFPAPHPGWEFIEDHSPHATTIFNPWSHKKAEREYLSMFKRLYHITPVRKKL